MVQRIDALGYNAELVSTAELATPGFLNSFSAVVVSRYDSGFGSGLSSAAAAEYPGVCRRMRQRRRRVVLP